MFKFFIDVLNGIKNKEIVFIIFVAVQLTFVYKSNYPIAIQWTQPPKPLPPPLFICNHRQ